MLGEGVQELSVFGRKDLHDLAGAADRHLPLVGRDVGGQHRIGLIADRCEPLAGGDVEEHGRTVLHRLATRGEQHAARRAELQHERLPLGKGDGAVALVFRGHQLDRLVGGHRRERCPWAGGQSQHGVGTVGLAWLEGGQVGGHRWWTVVGLRRRRRLEAECAGGCDGAAGILPKARVDPGLDHRDLVGRQSIVVGRHPGVGVLGRDHFQEPAGARTARHHHRAAAAALHDGGIRCEVEPRLLLRVTVALQAVLLENPGDVVVEGDRLGIVGRGWHGGHRHARHDSGCHDEETQAWLHLDRLRMIRMRVRRRRLGGICLALRKDCHYSVQKAARLAVSHGFDSPQGIRA